MNISDQNADDIYSVEGYIYSIAYYVYLDYIFIHSLKCMCVCLCVFKRANIIPIRSSELHFFPRIIIRIFPNNYKSITRASFACAGFWPRKFDLY